MATTQNRTPRIYQEGPSWYADLRISNKRTRRSLGQCESRKEARERANALQAEADQLGVPVLKGHTFHDALRSWLNADTRGATDASILNKIMALYPDRRIGEVTEDSLSEKLKLKPGNWNRYVSTIKAALKRYAETHKTPIPSLKKRRVAQAPPRYLSEGEWKRLHAVLPPELLAPAELAITTGLRQANVFGLTWNQVNLRNRTVVIPATMAKGGAMLHLPLSPSAIAVLKRQEGRHDLWVFPDGDGPMLFRKKLWKAAKAKAKVSITWHGLRHTWASWHVLKGTPLKVLQQLGGWASIEMVQVYSHLETSHLEAFAANVELPSTRPARKRNGRVKMAELT